jgi:outer membrane biosynthesis protein TonB
VKLTPRSRPTAGTATAVLLLALLVIVVVARKYSPDVAGIHTRLPDTTHLSSPDSTASAGPTRQDIHSVSTPSLAAVDSGRVQRGDTTSVFEERRSVSSPLAQKTANTGANTYARYSVEYRWSGGGTRRRLQGGTPRVASGTQSMKFGLEAVVSPAGRVRRVQVNTGPQDRLIRERVTSAVQLWQFAPAAPANRTKEQKCRITVTILSRRG